MSLKEEIRELAQNMGIDKIGFTSRERLADAPPSGDLSYVLPAARSAISLAMAFDKEAIRAYFTKEDQMGHIRDHAALYIKLTEVARAIQAMLKDRGYESSAPLVNNKYRKNQPFMALVPPLSHRYVAVASGIGWPGWSGNLITPEFGAAVAISSVVTSAELEPDEPLEQGDQCRSCKLCSAICPSHFISPREECSVTISGRTYTHNKKAANLRCVVTCGGANGVRNAQAAWSTWSYKILDLPGPGDDEAFEQKVFELSQDPKNRLLKGLIEMMDKFTDASDLPDWEHYKQYIEDYFIDKKLITCGNCMLMCWPDMQDRKENFRLITTSGRVIRSEHGPVVVKG